MDSSAGRWRHSAPSALQGRGGPGVPVGLPQAVAPAEGFQPPFYFAKDIRANPKKFLRIKLALF